jgi:hypothetical protein
MPSPQQQPEITIGTPDTESPEEELAQTKSEPVFENGGVVSEGERIPLRHAVTAPGRVDSPASDAEIALERHSENVSPTDKG